MASSVAEMCDWAPRESRVSPPLDWAESCRPGLRELFEKKPAAFEKKLCGPPLRGVSRERHSLWPICHEIPAENCAQCRWMAFGQKWTKAYGTVTHTVSGRHVETFS